jgi:hypothetical protein
VSTDLLDSAFFKASNCTYSVEVRKRLVLSLILLHVNYGYILFTGDDSVLQRKLGVAFVVCSWFLYFSY